MSKSRAMRCSRRAALSMLGSAVAGCNPEQDERVRRIVYWEKWTDFEGQAMGRVVDAFNARERRRAAAEPGYRPIEVEYVPVSHVEQKLLVAIAGKRPPDVSGMYAYMLAAYTEKGALTELTPWLAKAAIRRSDYIPHFFDLGVHRGKVWSLPATPASVALHWNKRLFREAELDPEKPPRTIEELDRLALRLTRWEVTSNTGKKSVETGYLEHVPADKKRLLQVGFSHINPVWWPYAWGWFFGGRLVEPDGRVTTDSEENVRAFEWVASYSKRLGPSAIQRFRSGFGKFSTPNNPFLSGKIAMQLQGVWMYNYIDKYRPGLDYGVAPMPYPADRPDLANSTIAECDILVIPRDSRHPNEAFEFIRYVSTQETMEMLCLGQQKFSPLAKVTDEFWQKHAHPQIRLFHALGSSPNAHSAPPVGVWGEYIREMDSAMETIVNLNAPPREVLSAVQSRMQAAVDRERTSLARRQRG